jgi:competence protein ComEA
VLKSRSGRENPARAAYSVPSSRGYVRISGDVRHAGMYPLSANMMTIAAIKLAEPLPASLDGIMGDDSAAYLENGMALHVTVRPNGTLLLTKSRMPVSERLVMGVPLDINAMSEVDFDKVPGIGPKMAKRIAEYRQNNGGRMTVPDLLLIDGIGEKKYNRLLKYF